MDILPLLDRCIAAERMAGEIYDILAERATNDTELRQFWLVMADDERQHAAKLEGWRELAVTGRLDRGTVVNDVEKELSEIERILADAKEAAQRVENADDAFAIALELEMSELDLMATTLQPRSPVALCTEIEKIRRREMTGQHEALVRAVRARSRSEQNLARAALLAAAD